MFETDLQLPLLNQSQYQVLELQNSFKRNFHIDYSIEKTSEKMYFPTLHQHANVFYNDIVNFFINPFCQIFPLSLPKYFNYTKNFQVKSLAKEIYELEATWDKRSIILHD